MLPILMPMDPALFSKKVQETNTLVLDVRSYEAFGGQHIPGAYHIDLGGNFATFAGWVLPPDANILLVVEDREQAEEAVTWLRRVGLDKTLGYLDGGMYEWAKAGLPMAHVSQLSVEELDRKMKGGPRFGLIDVRAKREFQTGHIEGAVNIPGPDLRTQYKVLDPKTPLVVMCNTGHRSSLAASLLLQRGFKEVYNLAGGMTGYNAARKGGECSACVAPHLPGTEKQ
jgi:rhodanese-related sulfurtransferase